MVGQRAVRPSQNASFSNFRIFNGRLQSHWGGKARSGHTAAHRRCADWFFQFSNSGHRHNAELRQVREEGSTPAGKSAASLHNNVGRVGHIAGSCTPVRAR
ncbi:hypothetical protein HPB52_005083 [Rhipicephalus sanguineus]|uniref:Uncharacterized protein n=1 Tax=Rhipicephalus sanguineus TaxID=34632 RepID=A0A9D4Q4N0_RHISA|nr:hypothetical protein HPB52_005083 [Rhipicephalus sanguineus]